MEQILLEAVQRHMERVDVIDDIHHGCTKGFSAFCDGVAVLVEEGRGTDLICLNLAEHLVLPCMASLSVTWRDMDLTEGPLGGYGIVWMSTCKELGVDRDQR